MIAESLKQIAIVYDRARPAISSPVLFLSLFLAPFFLYYSDDSMWWHKQLLIQGLICLLGCLVKSWRFTAVICLGLIVYHNITWLMTDRQISQDCFKNADLITGTIHSSSYQLKRSNSLIRVMVSCQKNKVRVPVMLIQTEQGKTKKAFYREGDLIEFSRFTIRKSSGHLLSLVVSKKTGWFNLSRKNNVLGRSALLIYIQNKARYYMSQFPSTIFQTLVTADNSRLGKKWKTLIKELGIAHLFAISGMHVGIIYLWVTYSLRVLFSYPLKVVNKGYALLAFDIIALMIIYLFVDLIGMPISARRAYTMLGWGGALRFLLAWQPLWYILLGTAAFVLVGQAMAINQLSFQLSFLAVAGIVIIIPYLPLRNHHDTKIRMLKSVLYSSFFISCWLSLIMFPLINRIFPFIFPLSIFGNVFHIFYMGWIYLPLSLLALCYTVISYFLGGLPGEFYLYSLVNVAGKLWGAMMNFNAQLNNMLFWQVDWNWTAFRIVLYWFVLGMLLYAGVRLKLIRKSIN